ncbi:hypothetical protein KIPB_004825 [Kipferlia bialata]|uniref:Uncharacterized protein n=1 Tax=Kipferlia bialata TaxID=797122 RepID=A0A391NVW8_9EUKA|nr:hypothetical protein KIPB_004825 [Kipferlia bialata]|eukprot:g4825.t1
MTDFDSFTGHRYKCYWADGSFVEGTCVTLTPDLVITLFPATFWRQEFGRMVSYAAPAGGFSYNLSVFQSTEEITDIPVVAQPEISFQEKTQEVSAPAAVAEPAAEEAEAVPVVEEAAKEEKPVSAPETAAAEAPAPAAAKERKERKERRAPRRQRDRPAPPSSLRPDISDEEGDAEADTEAQEVIATEAPDLVEAHEMNKVGVAGCQGVAVAVGIL